MRFYFNLKTGDIRTLPNFDDWLGADEEPWKDEIKEIDEAGDDYLEFEGFETHESFQIVVDFAERIEEPKLRDELIKILNRPKPFQNFKWQIDRFGVYRQQWFDFKKMRCVNWVKEQIDLNEMDFQ
jgi:hypothetical protein